LSRRFDVIALDMRGFGDSEKPRIPPPEGFNLDMLVDDISGLMASLELP